MLPVDVSIACALSMSLVVVVSITVCTQLTILVRHQSIIDFCPQHHHYVCYNSLILRTYLSPSLILSVGDASYYVIYSYRMVGVSN